MTRHAQQVYLMDRCMPLIEWANYQQLHILVQVNMGFLYNKDSHRLICLNKLAEMDNLHQFYNLVQEVMKLQITLS